MEVRNVIFPKKIWVWRWWREVIWAPREQTWKRNTVLDFSPSLLRPCFSKYEYGMSSGGLWIFKFFYFKILFCFISMCIRENITKMPKYDLHIFCLSQSVHLLSHVLLFATPWTAAHQASLSITKSWSLLKLMSIESMMPSNHFILCRPLLLPPSIFPGIRVLSNESVLHIRWPKYGVLASVSVLSMNTQDWSSLGWTGWISLQSKGLSRVFSNTTVQKHQFFSAHLCL